MKIDCEKAVENWLNNNLISLDSEHKELLVKAYFQDINENYRDEEIRYLFENYMTDITGKVMSLEECKNELGVID